MAVVTEALVLHAFDYLETSRILRLVTRSHGVVSVLARGAKRSVKRFGSALDLFASGSADIDVRPNRDLHTLRSFDVTNVRVRLAQDLAKFAGASMLCELVLRCSAGEEQGELFHVLTVVLDDLADASHATSRQSAIGGAWRVTAALGFAPAIEDCASCHRGIEPTASARFSHSLGGVVCDSCSATGKARGGRTLPAAARAHIQRWLRAEPLRELDDQTLRAHVRLLGEFVRHHVAEGVELKAFGAWASHEA